MQTVVSILMNAAGIISVLALVAVGLAIVFGMMNVINLAHGEFVTVGAYTAALCSSKFGSFWIGLILAPLVGAALGLGLEVLLIRHLYKRPLHTIIATLGISFIGQKLLELMFGPSPMSIGNPLPGLITIAGASYPLYRVFVVGSAILVMSIVLLLYRRSGFGLDLRSAIQNPGGRVGAWHRRGPDLPDGFCRRRRSRCFGRRAACANRLDRPRNGAVLSHRVILRGDRRRHRNDSRQRCRQRGDWRP